MSFTSRRRAGRSLAAGVALTLASSAAVLGAMPAAHAADKIPFIVIGTSDVSDSGLVANVIEPRFEALYPQYDLQYVAKGTGAALTDARNGLGAAVIVHAASVENQFVGDGYSLEQYGHLAFWGDYVLLGPNSDPAGVATSDSHDVVGAFEKVAAAGVAGRATFITRGGTPGTAVQEHALWKLTSGIPTCAVGGPSGGGTRPYDTADANSRTTCTSPDDQDGSDGDGAERPAWYAGGSSTSQATNVNLANDCAAGPYPNGSCYVFTDRGTYKNLRAQGLAQNLKIVTRDNAATVRGGRDALINVFHAYGVNPAKFSNPATTKTDPVAAKLFLEFMTATATQQAIGAWLSSDGDPAFVPAASPVTTVELASDKVTAGKRSTITGSIANAVPGYPALSGVSVTLLRAKTGSALEVPKVVATALTDASGGFTFSTKLQADSYRVGVPQISKIELPLLTPAFGSILTATSAEVGSFNGFKVGTVKRVGAKTFKLVGKLKSVSDGKGKVKLLAGQGKKLRLVGKAKVKDGRTRFVLTGPLSKLTGRYQLVFTDAGGTTTSLSKVQKVTVRR